MCVIRYIKSVSYGLNYFIKIVAFFSYDPKDCSVVVFFLFKCCKQKKMISRAMLALYHKCSNNNILFYLLQ